LSDLHYLPPYIFNDIDLKKFLRSTLSGVELFSGRSPKIEVSLPDMDEVEFCRSANRTLTAKLIISDNKKEFIFSFPYPFSGVFLFRSGDTPDNSAGKWVWHPRLVGQPGIWRLRKYEKDDTSEWLRLVFLDGSYIDSNQKNQTSLENKQLKRKLNILRLMGSDFSGNDRELTKKCRETLDNRTDKTADDIKIILTDAYQKVTGLTLDVKSLEWQRLQTFSSYLAERTINWFMTQKPGTLTKKSKSPLKIDLISERTAKSEQRQGRFHYFDPLNPLDALSSLNSLQRYNLRSEQLEQLPAGYRQNHPSFAGRICPVETPESKKVGLTLHLVRGLGVDILGRFAPTKYGSDDTAGLGWGASMVPFYEFNDGARAMMGAKNLKQALPLQQPQKPLVETGSEAAAAAEMAPLIQTGLLPKTFNRAFAGVDLLVAYLPWYGWNMEDAIVADRRLCDEGTLDGFRENSFVRYLKPGLKLIETAAEIWPAAKYFGLDYDKAGLFRLNHSLTPQTPLAFFMDLNGAWLPVYCESETDGELVEITYHPPAAAHLGGSLSWKIRYNYPLNVGDKLMGRYGNKGVIGKIVPTEEMPSLPNNKRLPENLRGRKIDLILNPHGVISRMNLGQLLETQTNLLQCLNPDFFHSGKTVSGRAFTSFSPADLASGFRNLKNSEGPGFPVDEYGRIRLRLGRGKLTQAPVTVGFQHFVRLNHIAAGKTQVRGGGADRKKYLYDLRTGQPVSGRRRRGGQRLGEMEIWALAANQAGQVVKNALTRKSDPSSPPANLTFRAIQDHLYASGIKLSQSNGKWSLQWLDPEKLRKAAASVNNPEFWEKVESGSFRCPKENCSYHYPNSEIAASGTRQRQKGKNFLTLKDVLRAHKLKLKTNYEAPLELPETEEEWGAVKLTLISASGKETKHKCSYQRKTRTLSMKTDIGGQEIRTYRQIDKKEDRFSPEDLLATEVTCRKHTTQPLQCPNPRPQLQAVIGGLADETLFGTTNVGKYQSGRGGYIALPADIFLNPQKADRKSPLIEALRQQAETAPECLLPVLPLRYRAESSRLIEDMIVGPEDAFNKIYANLTTLAVQLKKHPENTFYKKKIFDGTVKLAELLEKRLFGKFGLLRRAGLGRRVDFSARLVVVPDPSLPWDGCGIPAAVLFTLLGAMIAAHPEFIKKIKQDYRDDAPLNQLLNLLPGTIDRNSRKQAAEEKNFLVKHEELVRNFLNAFLKERPQTSILLNRQPSLHRYSMMGFKPFPRLSSDGSVLRINPLVCKGFGADFDGDEMVVHAPVDALEERQIETMKPTRSWNLVSFADGSEPMANFDQDFVCGHFYISLDESLRSDLKKIFRENNCSECLKILDEKRPWKKDHGLKLIRSLQQKYDGVMPEVMERWSRLAFSANTVAGVSFGALELEEIRNQLKRKITELLPASDESAPEAPKILTEAIGDEVSDELEKIINTSTISDCGYGFAALARSGARGAKQTRQLVGGRGLLEPGEIAFAKPEADFFFNPRPLIEGMSQEASFRTAMNVRSSMMDKKLNTGKAGSLTRRLVLILWDWTVTPDDCGCQGERSPDRCLYPKSGRRDICAACYGPLPGYEILPENFPGGLIAAQSFGERGTQLSMQSFHTAQRQLSIDNIVSLLNGKDIHKHGKNWFKAAAADFVERLHQENAYRNIDERHLRLIWLAISSSGKKTLRGAWESARTPLSGLVGESQKSFLLQCAAEHAHDDGTSALVQVLSGHYFTTAANAGE